MEPGFQSLRANFLSLYPFPQAGHPWKEVEPCVRGFLCLSPRTPLPISGTRGWVAMGCVMLYRYLYR